MQNNDPQLQALANRVAVLETALYTQLQRPGSTALFEQTISQLSHQIKLAPGPNHKITLPASRGIILLQMLGVVMERMGLMKCLELASKEKENVKPNLKLSTDEPQTNP